MDLESRVKANVAKRVKAAPKGCKAELARHLEVCPAHITFLINDDSKPDSQRRPMRLRYIEGIAEYFKVKPQRLLD